MTDKVRYVAELIAELAATMAWFDSNQALPLDEHCGTNVAHAMTALSGSTCQ